MVLTRPDKLETAGRRKKRHAIYPGRRVWKGEGENEGNRRAFAGAAEAAGGKIDVALDTDTYNEIDDQFALAYLLSSPEKMNVKAIYAAPFHNEKSDGPADGMEKSFQEIHRILGLVGREELKERVFRGSRSYLADETQPVISPAAEHLAGLAMRYTPQKPLYVAALGAITNVASAMLLQPEIRDRIVLVWLGGNAHWWPDNREFNLMQDVAAARWYSEAEPRWCSCPVWAWYPGSPSPGRSWNGSFAEKTRSAII